MLKTPLGDHTRLIHQPHHAIVSAYLAAHWGNSAFAAPGMYPGATEPVRWREEVMLGIAEHDNGWWEWEADPAFADDGLPVSLQNVAQRNPNVGFDRWRIGVPRLAEKHPYAALLIAMHAHWLYAVDFVDLVPDQDTPMRHPLFTNRGEAPRLVANETLTRAFLDELTRLRAGLGDRIAADPVMATALEPDHLNAHTKLLQLADAISLLLCFGDRGDRDFPEIPRASWANRVSMAWRRAGERTFTVDPYPFDVDPLPVLMPVRIIEHPIPPTDTPLTRLHGAPLRTIEFTLSSA